MIEKIANMLGVELYEEFKIKPTKMGEVMGYKPIDRTFRFDPELVYKGYNDGWSEWYGFECDKILYNLILGKYEIIKKENENMNEKERMNKEEFEKAMESAVKWFNENCNPHQRIIIEMGGVELVSGEMAFTTEIPD